MAEILIAARDTLAGPRGAVLAIKFDGWRWTEAEQSSAAFKIVSVPDATVERLIASGICEPEVDEKEETVAPRRYLVEATVTNSREASSLTREGLQAVTKDRNSQPIIISESTRG